MTRRQIAAIKTTIDASLDLADRMIDRSQCCGELAIVAPNVGDKRPGTHDQKSPLPIVRTIAQDVNPVRLHRLVGDSCGNT